MNDDEQTIEAPALNYIDLTADLVSAYVTNNRVSLAEIPALIADTHVALTGLAQPAASAEPTVEKATPTQIRKSITHEALISFEDGKPYKTLKRHLGLRGLTPGAYKAKWGLPADYPVTAAGYSESRSKLAHALGLGQSRRKAAPEPKIVAAAAEKPKRGRPQKTKEPAGA